jgi:hypothetical protein
MRKYTVKLEYIATTEHEVEADNEKDAIENARERDFNTDLWDIVTVSSEAIAGEEIPDEDEYEDEYEKELEAEELDKAMDKCRNDNY